MKKLFFDNILFCYLLLSCITSSCGRDYDTKNSKSELNAYGSSGILLDNGDIMKLIDEDLISTIPVGLNDTLVKILYKRPFQEVIYLSIFKNDSLSNLTVKKVSNEYFNPFLSTRKNQLVVEYNTKKIILNDIQLKKLNEIHNYLIKSPVKSLDEYQIDGGYLECQIKYGTTVFISNLILPSSESDSIVLDRINKFVLEINKL